MLDPIVDPLLTALDDDLDLGNSITIQVDDLDDPILPDPPGMDTTAPTLILEV